MISNAAEAKIVSSSHTKEMNTYRHDIVIREEHVAFILFRCSGEKILEYSCQ